MRFNWQKFSVAISLISLLLAGFTAAYTYWVVVPTQLRQAEENQRLQALVYNYTTKVIPFVAGQPEFTDKEFGDFNRDFHVTLYVIIDTPHSGYVTVTQTGFQFDFYHAFNNQSTVTLIANPYIMAVSGSSELTFNLMFEPNVFANGEWFDSHNLTGIGGYFGSVDLQVSFHDAPLNSTTTTPFALPVVINYSRS